MGPFQGSLTNLGASGRLQSQIQAILGQILTFPDPPCQLGQLKWSEMACTGVPQIVLHISYSTRTYWGHFRPCKVSYNPIAEVFFVATAERILKLLLLGHFLKRFALNCIDFSRPEAENMDISLIG